MIRTPNLMQAIAIVAEAAGLFLLLRPAAVRRLLGVAESGPATYILRMLGAMLAALGLFLGGFATVYRMASA